MTTFATFSPNRLFVPLGSNITEGTFPVPGTSGTAPATVAGFGVVFADVDLANTSSLQFFDSGESSLGTFAVPVSGTSDGSLSFLGVLFTTERIARVRIVSGNTALGPMDNPGSGIDVVAMDDFLYAEPRAVPEAAGLPWWEWASLRSGSCRGAGDLRPDRLIRGMGTGGSARNTVSSRGIARDSA